MYNEIIVALCQGKKNNVFNKQSELMGKFSWYRCSYVCTQHTHIVRILEQWISATSSYCLFITDEKKKKNVLRLCALYLCTPSFRTHIPQFVYVHNCIKIFHIYQVDLNLVKSFHMSKNFAGGNSFQESEFLRTFFHKNAVFFQYARTFRIS